MGAANRTSNKSHIPYGRRISNESENGGEFLTNRSNNPSLNNANNSNPLVANYNNNNNNNSNENPYKL